MTVRLSGQPTPNQGLVTHDGTHAAPPCAPQWFVEAAAQGIDRSNGSAGGDDDHDGSAPDRPRWTGNAKECFKLLRPHQWAKNAFCLAGVLFTGQYLEPTADLAALATMLVFIGASSAIYVVNDVLDRDRDRQHPVKRLRPIARGTVRVPSAILLAAVLALGSLAGAYALHAEVLVCVVLQMLNNLAYSIRLKHVPLVDVLSIAAGFVLRLLAGVYVLGEVPTTWITLCTFFLALFLAIGKRRAELAIQDRSRVSARRPVLSAYTVQYLDQLLHGAAVMALLCYSLSTTTGENPSLVFTVPIVFFAVSHYIRLIMVADGGEEPETMVLRDPVLLGSVVVWLVLYLAIAQTRLDLVR